MVYQASSKGEAKYLIEHMNDPNGDTSAPTDFLNRASWNQMFPPPSGNDGIAGTPLNQPRRSRPLTPMGSHIVVLLVWISWTRRKKGKPGSGCPRMDATSIGIVFSTHAAKRSSWRRPTNAHWSVVELKMAACHGGTVLIVILSIASGQQSMEVGIYII